MSKKISQPDGVPKRRRQPGGLAALEAWPRLTAQLEQWFREVCTEEGVRSMESPGGDDDLNEAEHQAQIGVARVLAKPGAELKYGSKEAVKRVFRKARLRKLKSEKKKRFGRVRGKMFLASDWNTTRSDRERPMGEPEDQLEGRSVAQLEAEENERSEKVGHLAKAATSCLDKLSAEQRHVLVEQSKGTDSEQVCEELKISREYRRKLLERARKRIVECLEEQRVPVSWWSGL